MNKEERKKYMKQYYLDNKDNILKYQKKYSENNPKVKKYHSDYYKEWYKKNKHYVRKHHLKNSYNVTIEEYNTLFEKQNGCCAICGKHQSEFILPLFVEHCHKTGKVRGLMCNKCNVGIGCFEDNPIIINNALKYINKNL